jgi:hypothetical protein
VGALLITRLQLPEAPEVIEPSEQLETDYKDQVQALAQGILSRGAAARAAVTVSAGQGAQRPEGETDAKASRGATQPGTMPPPPTPTRTTGAPAIATGPQTAGGPPGSNLLATVVRPEVQRREGLRPPTGPTVEREEREEVPSVARNEKGATQREKATETELNNTTEAVAVREQRVHTRAQMRAAEEVEVLEEVNLIEDTKGTESIMTERRVSKKEQKAPDRYGGSEKNAWITQAKKKTARIEKG